MTRKRSKDPLLTHLQEVFEEAMGQLAAEGTDEKLLLNGVEQAIAASRRTYVELIGPELRKRASSMLSERRRITKGFEVRNYKRWREAFDDFERLIVMVEEACEANDEELRPKAIEDQDFRFEAIGTLLPRSILIAREILCLLRGGFPDAALSRWRTLYEHSVTAQFLSENDGAISLRYLASYRFSALRAAKEMNALAERANLEPFADEDMQHLEDIASNAESQLGERLRKDYDWAHPALHQKLPKLQPDRVTFAHIEASVEMDHWRPRYRWANQHVHSGYRPHDKLLGVCESHEPVALVGQSNSGFVDPFQMAAISLVHVAISFLSLTPNLDRLAMIDLLCELRDSIPETALRLEKESMRRHLKKSMG